MAKYIDGTRERGPGAAAKIMWLMSGLSLMLLSFAVGRWSAAPAPLPQLINTQAPQPQMSLSPYLIQAQPDNDPRELLPWPGNPGQGPGGQGMQPGDGECPIYLYQDGQLFQFMPGQPGFPGGGDGSPELFPLQPPSAPRTPQPPPPFDGSDDIAQAQRWLITETP